MTLSRRRSPRVQALLLVTYEVVGKEPTAPVEVGRTLDVSAGGLRVETAVELEAGKELEIEIAVGNRLVRARGRVVHSEPGFEPMYETGIEFTEIDPAEREAMVTG